MRMKLLLIVPLLAILPAYLCHEDEFDALKKWAFAKAFGQCIGEDNMKKMIIKKKEAIRKCTGEPTPELELPIFKSAPYRVASGFVHAAQPYRGEDSEDKWMETAMKRFFFRKMMREMMEGEFADDEDDMMRHGPMRFFKTSRKAPFHRYRRDLIDDKNEIIEKLSEKLQSEKEKARSEIGNMTCMYRECGILDAGNNLVDPDEIIRHKEETLEIEDPWLKDEIYKSVRHCHSFASSVPQEMLDDCEYGPEFSYLHRVKFFKMCMKLAKAKICMFKDVKDKVETSFGPAQDIAKEVGLESVKQLLPLMHKILYGDMED